MALALPSLAWGQAAPTQPTAPPGPITLPAVQVEAPSQAELTEGTGSYAARTSNTATPLRLNLRETPQAVTVVTRQRMQDQRMQDVTNVVDNTTGVSVNHYETTRAQFNARGFKIDALLIDGVPTRWEQDWSSGEIVSSLAMYDRVDVVRGATGLMTGTGEPSAAINLVRKRAHSAVFTGSVALEAGNRNQRRSAFDLSTPVNAARTVRARVVGEYAESDSFVQGLGRKDQTIFATVEADLGTHTLLTAGLSRQRTDLRNPMWGGLPAWYSNGTRTSWDRSTSTAADWARWTAVHQTYFASLEHRLGNDWKLKASYARGERSADSRQLAMYGFPAVDTGAGMYTVSAFFDGRSTQDDLGLQASGRFRLAGRDHEAAFGYVHARQKARANDRAAMPALGVVADFRRWNGANMEPLWGPSTYYGSNMSTQQAAYGVARLSLADPLHLIVGARLSDYRKSSETRAIARQDIRVNNQVTPYAGLTYDIHESTSAFVSYTGIFEPQATRDLGGNALDPVTGRGVEAGLKAGFLDGRLNAAATAFRIRQRNLGVATGQQIVGPGGLLEMSYRGSAGAVSTGFDLEVAGELARGWNLGAGYTQYRLKDESGTDVNSVFPRKLLRVFSTYRLPGAWAGLTVGGGLSWQGRTWTVAPGPLGVAQTVSQSSYGLVDLMARYAINDRLSAQLNIRNALDKTYFNMSAAYGQINFGEPRSVNLSLRYQF